MSTAVNPIAIPKIEAAIEPITVPKPFTPQAQGMKAGDSLATRRKPIGNGMPRKTPSGAIIATTMTIRHKRGKPNAEVRIDCDKVAVRKEQQESLESPT